MDKEAQEIREITEQFTKCRVEEQACCDGIMPYLASLGPLVETVKTNTSLPVNLNIVSQNKLDNAMAIK